MTVQLFATCLGDLVFPTAVTDAEALLREAGHEVVFPRQQICCGQPTSRPRLTVQAIRVGQRPGMSSDGLGRAVW